MLWEVLWPLALGFILSAIVQTLVSRSAVARALGSDSPRSLATATLLGAASSSCSYAAVAIARSLFRKGASFPAAIVFEFASTNLVFELGLILLSLVCSVGNVTLAAVLWNGGISFGGVIAFIFADLIILPIVDIYRKYYGRRMALYLLVVSYAAMALAGFLIGLLFQLLGFVPVHHPVSAITTAPALNYTSVLNVIFLAIMALLGWWFLRTGGLD